MDSKFLFRLASKNLRGHKMRTYLTVIAMIIGVGAIVFLVGFAFGMQKLVEREVTGADAYELIDVGAGNSQIIKLNHESIEKIRMVNDVEAVEVIINAAGKAKNEGGDDVDFALFGTTTKYLGWSSQNIVIGNTLTQNSHLQSDSTITAGTTVSNDNNQAIREILINQSMANSLNIPSQDIVGTEITLGVIIPKELTAENKSQTYTDQKFEIVGFIKDNNTPSAFVNLEIIEAYGAGSYSQAKVRTQDRDAVSIIRKQIENLGFKTQYVGETIDQVNQVFNFFKIILGSFGLIAMIVAILGMFNTLTISLLEKTKEIALLKILGMRKKDIRKTFLLEAGVISAFGGFLGILLGFASGSIINNLLNGYAVKSGGDPISIFYYPWWFVAGVFAVTFSIGIFTGLYPAQRAAKINALDVLRYE